MNRLTANSLCHYLASQFARIRGHFLLSGGNWAAIVEGDYLTIVSAVCWAIHAVMIGRFVVRSGRPLLLAATQFTVLAFVAGLAVWISSESVLISDTLAG